MPGFASKALRGMVFLFIALLPALGGAVFYLESLFRHAEPLDFSALVFMPVLLLAGVLAALFVDKLLANRFRRQ